MLNKNQTVEKCLLNQNANRSWSQDILHRIDCFEMPSDLFQFDSGLSTMLAFPLSLSRERVCTLQTIAECIKLPVFLFCKQNLSTQTKKRKLDFPFQFMLFRLRLERDRIVNTCDVTVLTHRESQLSQCNV